MILSPRLSPSRRRRGSMLAEFAVVSMMLYGIVGAVLTFGMLYFSHQALQSAAETAAREISQTPLPANITFEEALGHPLVRDRIFSEDYLAIDISDWRANPDGRTLYQYLDEVVAPPTVNMQLYPLMIRQNVDGKALLRYPGALVESTSAPSGFTVVVPVIVGRGPNGEEDVFLARVIEEIDTELDAADNSGPNPDPFPITSPQRGIVALQMNLPYSSTTMAGGSGGLNWHLADDGAVAIVGGSLPSGGTALFDPTKETEGHPYAGEFGLGRMFANQSSVRPYRHLLTSRSIYRREVFQ